MSVLVIGSVALDTIKTPLGKGREVLGGSATYFSVSASFFSKVNLVAVVGNDFPSRYLNTLGQRGIDLRGLEIKKGKTFRWEGEYGWDFNDPRTISTCLNVFSHFKPRIPKEYTQSKYVFLANIDPQLQMNVLEQVKKPKLVVCDTMNYWIKNKRRDLIALLKKVDIFLLNDSEARMLTGKTNLAEVARIIRAWGPRYVIIKKGEHGAVLVMNNSAFSMPGLLLDSVVDPTGAGDTFAGGLVGYLAQSNSVNQRSLRRAVVFGSIMATFAVEQFSIRRLLSLTKSDVTKRFKEFKRLTEF